jgi:hypothetical protein
MSARGDASSAGAIRIGSGGFQPAGLGRLYGWAARFRVWGRGDAARMRGAIRGLAICCVVAAQSGSHEGPYATEVKRGLECLVPLLCRSYP